MNMFGIRKPSRNAEVKKQGRKTINRKIIGPVFINGTLTGEKYLNMLEHEVEEYLNDIAVIHRQNLIWQQDGAPVHSIDSVTNYLNNTYDLWIGSRGPIQWPAKESGPFSDGFFCLGNIKK
ncbi:hypothetical protein NQ317_001077 [Molorchus minor]|uniref:Transposase n=1 Tax=Molorchus minor TaxID=1323400 RepID=A0ABQ9JP14_9CUCU|nr:hypothetical protein NQ317_001077 [Molorchus minor]